METIRTIIDKYFLPNQDGQVRNHWFFTGLDPLDSLFNGFERGELVILYSPLGTQMASIFESIIGAVNSQKDTNSVFFLSLKQSTRAVVNHLLQYHTAEEIGQWPFYINDPTSITVDEMTNLITRVNQKENLSLILVDETDLLDVPDKVGSKKWVIDSVRFNALKQIAKTLDVPVVVSARATGDPYKMDVAAFYAANKYADRVALVFQPIFENVSRNEHGQPFTVDDYQIILYNTPMGEVRKSFCRTGGSLRIGMVKDSESIMVRVDGFPKKQKRLSQKKGGRDKRPTKSISS